MKRPAFIAVGLLLSFACPRTALLAGSEAALPLNKGEAASDQKEGDDGGFALYSTLAGKMARMEELLNAIDRFLCEPGFHDRLVADGAEFHRLLKDCRGLYPAEISERDRPLYDKAVDRTLIASGKLGDALRAGDEKAVRRALKHLDKLRRNAHARFSY